ncbi:hypothetical protein V4B17_04545 [Bartonella sp. B23]
MSTTQSYPPNRILNRSFFAHQLFKINATHKKPSSVTQELSHQKRSYNSMLYASSSSKRENGFRQHFNIFTNGSSLRKKQ